MRKSRVRTGLHWTLWYGQYDPYGYWKTEAVRRLLVPQDSANYTDQYLRPPTTDQKSHIAIECTGDRAKARELESKRISDFSPRLHISCIWLHQKTGDTSANCRIFKLIRFSYFCAVARSQKLTHPFITLSVGVRGLGWAVGGQRGEHSGGG